MKNSRYPRKSLVLKLVRDACRGRGFHRTRVPFRFAFQITIAFRGYPC